MAANKLSLLTPALLLVLWAAPAPAADDASTLLKEAREAAGAAADAPGRGETPARAPVYAVFARADTDRLGEALALEAPAASNARAAVYPVNPESLPRISDLMHERFKRCGGFFAYRTLEEARAALAAPAPAPGGPYTVDQQAFVRPVVGKVSEKDLRSTIEALAAFKNRYYESETGVSAARWLKDKWQGYAASLPGASVALVAHEWKQPSVVLTIPGTDLADEIVVLGGHLDSINGWGGADKRAPGADDNASGIATITESLRALAQARFKPRRTVQFMAYSAEEVGLRGSEDIARKYKAAGKKVVAVIQYDMTNFKGSPEDLFFLSDNTDPALTAFLGKLVDAYLPGARWSTTECGYGCSDHASWTQEGYPASAAFESSFEGMNTALHTERDTLATTGGTAAHSVPFAKLGAAFAAEAAKVSTGASPVARR